MNEQLHKKCLKVAYEQLQEAYGLIYVETFEKLTIGEKDDLDNAEKHLKNVSEWMLALIGDSP